MIEQDLQLQINSLNDRLEKSEQQPQLQDHQHNGIDSTKVDINDLDLNAYGYIYNNTDTTITVGTADTWYEIDSNFSDELIFSALFVGSHNIMVAQTGVYQIIFSSSLQTGTADQVLGLTIAKGGIALENPHENGTTVAVDKSINIAGCAILNLTAKDEISLAVKNYTLATDILVEHANLSLFRIG